VKNFIKRHWKKFLFILILAAACFAAWKYFAKPLIAKLKGETISSADIYTVSFKLLLDPVERR